MIDGGPRRSKDADLADILILLKYIHGLTDFMKKVGHHFHVRGAMITKDQTQGFAQDRLVKGVFSIQMAEQGKRGLPEIFRKVVKGLSGFIDH